MLKLSNKYSGLQFFAPEGLLQIYSNDGATATRISCDLATKFPDKWAALTAGEHTIQIRAKNPGNYLDSDLSTAITFVKVVNYSITATATNCTASASNPTTITYGTTATLKFTFPDGYEAPSDDGVTVTGATKSWTQSTGTLVLSNPTANVTVKVVGEEAVTEITGQWTWNETIPNAAWTQQAVEFKLADGTSYKKMLWVDDGTTYDLYYDDEQEPDEYGTKVYSYDTADEVGTWVDAKYRIVDFTPDSGIQYVTRSFYNYLETNATQATQLATPQNVTADGTVVSWDEVENATSYEVYADGTSIGTVKSLIKFSFSYPYNVTATSNYECEEGMTWEEFVNSGYNPVAGGENKRLYIYNGSVSQHNGPSAYNLVFTQGDDSSYVKAADKIVANHAYYESSGQ